MPKVGNYNLNVRQLKRVNYIDRDFNNFCERLDEKYRTDRSRGKPQNTRTQSIDNHFGSDANHQFYEEFQSQI